MRYWYFAEMTFYNTKITTNMYDNVIIQIQTFEFQQKKKTNKVMNEMFPHIPATQKNKFGQNPLATLYMILHSD